jgi:hypothetical protein
MKEDVIIHTVKAALTTAARGGLGASLFTDSVADDADMLYGTLILLNVPKSQREVVERGITEWREAHQWLQHMPDKQQ